LLLIAAAGTCMEERHAINAALQRSASLLWHADLRRLCESETTPGLAKTAVTNRSIVQE
jgi:hypothetical protein